MRIGCFTITAEALSAPGLEETIRDEILITYEAFHSREQCWCFIGTYHGFHNVKDYSIPIYNLAFRYEERTLPCGHHGRVWTQILVSRNYEAGDFLPPSAQGKPERLFLTVPCSRSQPRAAS